MHCLFNSSFLSHAVAAQVELAAGTSKASGSATDALLWLKR